MSVPRPARARAPLRLECLESRVVLSSEVPHIDVELTKVVDNDTPLVGSQVTYTVHVQNMLYLRAPGVVVEDVLPAGLQFESATATQGSYDPTTGVWEVGDLVLGPDGATLRVTVTVLSPEVTTNTAEVVAAGWPDIDSVPNNHNPDEDDQASATICPVVPAPPPPPAHGRMTGGGSAFTAGGQRVTHGFTLHCDPADGPNNLEINWGGNHFHLLGVTSASCLDDPAISPLPRRAPFDTLLMTGTGRLNGQEGYTIDLKFTDAGEPGRDDRMTVTIFSPTGAVVLTVEGNLQSGNHQAHPETGRAA